MHGRIDYGDRLRLATLSTTVYRIDQAAKGTYARMQRVFSLHT